MTSRMVAPEEAPTRFVSVHKPDLGVLSLLSDLGDEGDVWPCDECSGGTVHVTVRDAGYGDMDGERECEECEGYGYLHGYNDGGVGMPARPLGPDEEA